MSANRILKLPRRTSGRALRSIDDRGLCVKQETATYRLVHCSVRWSRYVTSKSVFRGQLLDFFCKFFTELKALFICFTAHGAPSLNRVAYLLEKAACE
jgi:hypothetical protein